MSGRPDTGSRQPGKTTWPRPWAELFRRVFREDLEVCPRCAGEVRVLAAITDPDAINAIRPRRRRRRSLLTGPVHPTIGDSFYVDLNLKYVK